MLSGRNILDMANRGARFLRKAMVFAQSKWDLKENVPKESGTTEAGVILFVRQQMKKKRMKNPKEN